MHRHLGLGLPLEEGVVKLLVIDVDLAQFGAHLLPHLGLHTWIIGSSEIDLLNLFMVNPLHIHAGYNSNRHTLHLPNAVFTSTKKSFLVHFFL